jgi:hypothetical protein
MGSSGNLEASTQPIKTSLNESGRDKETPYSHIKGERSSRKGFSILKGMFLREYRERRLAICW